MVEVASATPQRYVDDVEVGTSLPVARHVVDETQMFFFSAATYNGHRIHYDKTWAREVEGYDDVLVQGPLQAALMARTLTDWAGPAGRLVAIALQNRDSAFPGETLRFVATVVALRRDESGTGGAGGTGGTALVDLEIRGEKDGPDGTVVVLMPGTATVALPERS